MRRGDEHGNQAVIIFPRLSARFLGKVCRGKEIVKQTGNRLWLVVVQVVPALVDTDFPHVGKAGHALVVLVRVFIEPFHDDRLAPGDPQRCSAYPTPAGLGFLQRVEYGADPAMFRVGGESEVALVFEREQRMLGKEGGTFGGQARVVAA